MPNLDGKNQPKSGKNRMEQKTRAEREDQSNKAKEAVSGVQTEHQKLAEYVVYRGHECRVIKSQSTDKSVCLEDCSGKLDPKSFVVSMEEYQKAKDDSIPIYVGDYVRYITGGYFRVVGRRDKYVTFVSVDSMVGGGCDTSFSGTGCLYVVDDIKEVCTTAPGLPRMTILDYSNNLFRRGGCYRGHLPINKTFGIYGDDHLLIKSDKMVGAYSKVCGNGEMRDVMVGDFLKDNGETYKVKYFHGNEAIVTSFTNPQKQKRLKYQDCVLMKASFDRPAAQSITVLAAPETNETTSAPKKTRTIYRSFDGRQTYRLIAVSSDGQTNVYESYLNHRIETVAAVDSKDLIPEEVDETVFEYTVTGQTRDRTISFIVAPGLLQVGDKVERSGHVMESEKIVTILAIDTKDPNAAKFLSGTVTKKIPLPF